MSDQRSSARAPEGHPTERAVQGEGANETSPSLGYGRSVVSSQDLLYARRPTLTREEEIELAETIVQANRTMLEALVRSPVALEELAALAEECRDGVASAADLAPALPDDEHDGERLAAEVLGAIERVRSARKARRLERSAHGLEEESGRFVQTMLAFGLSRTAVERILGKLAVARQSRRGSARSAVDATFSAIDRGQRAADRAKETFVEANIGLVIMMAGKRAHSGLPLRDLVQEGCMGLMRAVEKFDHRRGVRFSTYAMWWIRHAVNRALSDQSRTIRVPVHLLETQFKVLRTTQEFKQQRGREPTDAELSERTGLPVEKLRAVSTVPREPLSMDAPTGAENEARLGDFVPDVESISTIDEISTAHVAVRLRHLLTALPPREAEVLRLRFGIDRPGTLTLEEIGRRFSVSRERIRQIEAEALATLRSRALAEDLDSHLAG